MFPAKSQSKMLPISGHSELRKGRLLSLPHLYDDPKFTKVLIISAHLQTPTQTSQWVLLLTFPSRFHSKKTPLWKRCDWKSIFLKILPSSKRIVRKIQKNALKKIPVVFLVNRKVNDRKGGLDKQFIQFEACIENLRFRHLQNSFFC